MLREWRGRKWKRRWTKEQCVYESELQVRKEEKYGAKGKNGASEWASEECKGQTGREAGSGNLWGRRQDRSAREVSRVRRKRRGGREKEERGREVVVVGGKSVR
jgi:hypothetical protein